MTTKSNERRFELWLVDDEPELCETFSDIFNEEFQVRWFLSADSALQELQRSHAAKRPEAILVDVLMPTKNGFQFAQETRGIAPEVSILLMTGSATRDMFVEAESLGVSGLVEKPFNIASVKIMLRRAILRRLHLEISSKISQEIQELISKDESGLNQLTERYFKAEAKLTADPAFWNQISREERQSLFNQLYRSSFLDGLLSARRLRLLELISQYEHFEVLLLDLESPRGN